MVLHEGNTGARSHGPARAVGLGLDPARHLRREPPGPAPAKRDGGRLERARDVVARRLGLLGRPPSGSCASLGAYYGASPRELCGDASCPAAAAGSWEAIVGGESRARQPGSVRTARLEVVPATSDLGRAELGDRAHVAGQPRVRPRAGEVRVHTRRPRHGTAHGQVRVAAAGARTTRGDAPWLRRSGRPRHGRTGRARRSRGSDRR